MTDPLHERVASTLGARYEIADEIGRGAMGVVYRARDVRLRRPVAIKVLPPELAFRDETRSRFLREAQTAAQLSHPSIVPIFSVDEHDGLVYFVMALVDGESLAARMRREPRVPIAAARRVLEDIADALAYAHERGIVHRDIKPDNILIDGATGRTLVSDFGIARAAEGDARLTAPGVAVGTPAYMSPEQAVGERELDGRSDLYSLGVVAYQMLAGELPFTAANTPAMLMKHIGEMPRPLRDLRPDVPEAMERAIERSLAKRREDRWSDAAAFKRALVSEAASAPAADRTRPAAHLAPQPPAHPAALHRAISEPPGRAIGEAAARNPASARPPAPLRPSDPSRRSEPLQPPATPLPGQAPPVPPWMPASWRDVRRQWRAAGRDQRELWREQRRLMKEQMRERADGVAAHALAAGQGGEPPVEYRIRSFRMHLARNATSVAVLAGINIVTTPFVPWFLFPAAFMSFSVLRRGGALWADGVRMKDVFGKEARLPANAPAGAGGIAPDPRAVAASRAAALAPADVLAGPHGSYVRRAAEDQHAIRDAIGKLSKADRELIPDVVPTVDALVERIAALAQALQRLDEDVSADAIARLDERIAVAEGEPEGSDREKKLSLLRRQRATLGDLLGRREGLVGQIESASLMLQNIRLDLVALRNAGVQSSIDDVSHATQEARALSRDIGHVLDAAKQVRG